MSAFMVADETINRVANWLQREVYRSSFLRERTEQTFGFSADSKRWAETVGQMMFQLNIRGVEDRYGDGQAGKFRNLRYRFVPESATTIYNTTAKMQVLKSLQCWLYQCAEGEVVKQPLYRFFREVVEPHLMSSIINDLPDYDRAVWG